MDKKPKSQTSEAASSSPHPDAAADVIRKKLENIYAKEPDAQEEIEEVKGLEDRRARLSKHQKYMERLSTSGRSLAEIQTAWHEYYQALPSNEKHQVWQEFYSQYDQSKSQAKPAKPTGNSNAFSASARRTRTRKQSAIQGPLPVDPKEDLLNKVTNRAAKNRKRTHAHSLVFGLGMGSLVVFILLFSFFNERFITPFIRPSHNVSATPIIVDPNNSGSVGPESKIIIPKINVEAPVVYDEPSIEEKAIQKALERGVVHYAVTPEPGEVGNSVIVGHSSSNILNSGKYKFAFLLLKSLENGDTFIVQKDKKRYVYKVYKKFVTNPSDVSVLDPQDKKSMMTLITCDPPGLSVNRLIIQAEQIFPNPSTNKPSSVDTSKASVEQPSDLPGNSPSLWSRITDALFN